MSLLPPQKRQQIEMDTMYFHALLQADADGDLLINKEDWKGGLNSLRREMEEIINAQAVQNKLAIDQVREELSHEMASFRREVTSMLRDLGDEVRTIRKNHAQGGITLSGKNVVNAVKAVKSIGRQGKDALFGN